MIYLWFWAYSVCLFMCLCVLIVLPTVHYVLLCITFKYYLIVCNCIICWLCLITFLHFTLLLDRSKRSSLSLFQRLAEETGGKVYETSKANIAETLVKVLEVNDIYFDFTHICYICLLKFWVVCLLNILSFMHKY